MLKAPALIFRDPFIFTNVRSSAILAAASPDMSPAGPAAPVAPTGMPKLRVGCEVLPTFTTVAREPAASVVTVPTAIVVMATSMIIGAVTGVTMRLITSLLNQNQSRNRSQPMLL